MLKSAALFVLLLSMCQSGLTLTCYDNTNGNMEIKTDDEWEFCQLIPRFPFNQTVNGTVYGLNQQIDDLDPYISAFEFNSEQYRILSMCIFERYDAGFLSAKLGEPEILFRCVCNYDQCNSSLDFRDYLSKFTHQPV